MDRMEGSGAGVEESGAGVEEETGEEMEEAGLNLVEAGDPGIGADSGLDAVLIPLYPILECGAGAEMEGGDETEGVFGVTHGEWLIPSRRCHEISLSNKVRKEHTYHCGTSFSHYTFSPAASFCIRSQLHFLQTFSP